MPVEVCVVHDWRVAALHARAPLRPEAIAKTLAVAVLAPALVEGMRIHPQEPHQRVQLPHLQRANDLLDMGVNSKGERML